MLPEWIYPEVFCNELAWAGRNKNSRTGKEKSQFKELAFPRNLVPRRGLEPPHLAALVPETSASTNFATWATENAHYKEE